jgi:hypothetical protein
MIYYEPQPSDGYELCHPIEDEGFETINTLINGYKRLSSWKKIGMKLIHEDAGKKLKPADSPWLGSHALIFKRKAIECVGYLLKEFGELLPLNSHEDKVYLYNPTILLDALDEARSSLLRFSDGRIMGINKYEFYPNVIEGMHIFKIPNLRVSPTFVSERFVNFWHESELTGLEFKAVYKINRMAR